MKKITALIALIMLLCGCKNIEDVQKTATVTEPTETISEADDGDGIEPSAEAVLTTSDIPGQTTVTTTTEVISATTAETTAPEPPETYTVRLVCAGDNLIHTPIYRIAHEVTGGNGYDFTPAYEHLGTLISDPDLAILNQETLITDDYEPSTYPSFATPTEMAKNMLDLGFDAFSISNNHVLDKGENGLISSLNFWRETYPGVPVYGAYLNEDDMNDIRTLEVNGITFAFLGYMEHTNGLSLPAGSECRVTYLSQENLIEQQVRRAAEIADCVIVSVHFGVEVTNIIMDYQVEMSQKLADWGADLIVGTQPHTIQSMEYIDTADGRRAFVFYCLGNFISAMDNPLSMAELLGEITVTKQEGDHTVTLSDAEAIPLVNHFDRSYSYVGVYPFKDYTTQMASVHAIPGVSYEQLRGLFRDNVPEEFLSSGYRELIYGD